MAHGVLNYNNGQLHYQTTGAGVPIVFMHGFTLDHAMWQPQVDFFAKTNQVITYDARGFGKSSVPNSTYDHAADLHALLTHLGVQQAHLVGLSMGGRNATNFTLEYPDMVRSLTLMDSALDGYANEVDWSVFAKEQGVKKAKQNWLNHDIFVETRGCPEAMAILRPIVEEYSGWHWLHDDARYSAGTQARSNLHKMTQPTLILVGQNDLPYFHNIARVLAGAILDAKKVVVPNTGHMVNLEAPEIVNKLVAQFIA